MSSWTGPRGRRHPCGRLRTRDRAPLTAPPHAGRRRPAACRDRRPRRHALLVPRPRCRPRSHRRAHRRDRGALARARVRRLRGGIARLGGAPRVRRPAPHRRYGRGQHRYALLPSVWRRGFGAELCAALLEYGFSGLGLPEIVAVVDPRNTASVALAERSGLSLRGETTWQGQARLVFALTRAEFEARR